MKKLSIIGALSVAMLFSCNKEEKYDVFKFGYVPSQNSTFNDNGRTMPSGGSISMYSSTKGLYNRESSDLIYSSTADQQVTIQGKSEITGFEEVTDSKDFLDGSGQYYIHAILDDTISNIPLDNDIEKFQYWIQDLDDKDRDVFEYIAEMDVTYENWWRNTSWKLDSTKMGGVSGTPSSCAEDNRLNFTVDQGYIYIKYDEGNNVCAGQEQEVQAEFDPQNETVNFEYNELGAGLYLYNSNTNFYINFDKIKFQNETQLEFHGEASNGSNVIYYFSKI